MALSGDLEPVEGLRSLWHECAHEDAYDRCQELMRRMGAKSDTEDLWLLDAMLDGWLWSAPPAPVGQRLVDNMPALKHTRGRGRYV